MRPILAALLFFPALALASVTPQTDKTGPFLITGLPQTIAVGFPFQQASDLVVLDQGTIASPRDPAVVLTLGSDYTVTGGGYNTQVQMQTGSIAVVSTGANAVLVNDLLVIMRGAPFNQTTAFSPTGPLTINLLEQALDKIATLSQQVNEIGSRSLQFEPWEFSGNGGSSLYPYLQNNQRAGKVIGFSTTANADGSFPINLYPATGGGGGGVSQIVAGTNVTVSPAGGTGVVTVNASSGSFTPAGTSGSLQWNSTGTLAGTWNGTVGVEWLGSYLENLQNQNSFLPLGTFENLSSGTSTVGYINVSNGGALGSSTIVGITGINYSGNVMTGGPAGEVGFIETATAIPLGFGVGGTAFAYGDATGLFHVVSTLITNSTPTLPAILVGGYAGNPSTLAEGDLWENTSTHTFNAVLNGSTVSLQTGSSVGTTVATIAALKALSVAALSTGYQAQVQGYYASGDAAGTRFYTYNSASSASDDGGSVIAPGSGSGRWLINTAVVPGVKPDVSWWGAYGDNSHNDTAAISKACTWLQAVGGGTLSFTTGATYLINPTVNTNWITFGAANSGTSGPPLNLAFNGCTLNCTTSFTPSSGQYLLLFLFYSCSPVKLGTVHITGQVMAQADKTGYTAFDFLSSAAAAGTNAGCTNVFAEPIYQTGGQACVQVYRNANGASGGGQGVAARSSGLTFTLIQTTGCYYPLQLQHSGDNTTASVNCVGAFRPAFVFGCKDVHLNVVDQNHNGSLAISCYDETSGGGWNDDPYTQNIWVDYTCLAGTLVRSTTGPNIILELNGPNPCYVSGIHINETVNESSTYPEGVLIEMAKTTNGSDDVTAGRGHILDNIDFSAHVTNAQAQADLLAFFASSDNPEGGGVGVGAAGNWSGESAPNLHIHDVDVQGNSGATMEIYHPICAGELVENVDFSGTLTQTGLPNTGTQLTNTLFNGTAIGPYISSGTAYLPQSRVENTKADANGAYRIFQKQRAGATVQASDIIGALEWQGWDGSTYQNSGTIYESVGTPSSGHVPAKLVLASNAIQFFTGGDNGTTQALSLDSSQNATFSGTVNFAGGANIAIGSAGVLLQGGSAGNDSIYFNNTNGAAIQGGSGSAYDLSLIAAGNFVSLGIPSGSRAVDIPSAYITQATGTGITVNDQGAVRHLVYKTTTTYAAYSAGAKTADLTIATLPAKAKITAFYADVTTGFTGGGESAATLTVGISAGSSTILAAGSCFTTHTWGLADADMGTAMTRAAAIQGGYIPNWSGTQIINARLTTTTNNTSGLTAGLVTYYIVTDVFP